MEPGRAHQRRAGLRVQAASSGSRSAISIRRRAISDYRYYIEEKYNQ